MLIEDGHKVDLLTIYKSGPLGAELNDDGKVIELDSVSRIAPKKWKAFVSITREYDLIHVHGRGAVKYVSLADWLFRIKRPIVFHDHFGREYDSIPRVLRCVLSKRNIHYVAVSQMLCEWAIKKSKIGHDKCFLLSNTVRRWNGQAKEKDPRSGLKIMLVSNIGKNKNVSLALEVVRRVNDLGCLTRLDVYGQPIERDVARDLRKQRADLNLEGLVTFVEDCTNVQAEMHRYELAIHTSLTESGPLTVIEFLAQELPFFTSNTGDVIRRIQGMLPDSIIDGYDPDSWANRIFEFSERLEAGQVDHAKLGQTYEDEFSESNYLAKCLKIYQQILSSRKRPS